MSRDLDTRARRAASNLRDVMSDAQLSSVPRGAARRRRALFAVLRPAWVVALLLLGSAVGVAMVLDSSPTPTPTTEAVVTTTTVVVTTTAEPPATTEPAPPTTAAVVPVAPTTTEARDTEPPSIEITSPENGAESEEKTITFAGTTEPGARVFAGKYEADVDGEGNWHIVLILSEGKNVARFVARDGAGNEAEASVTVYYVVSTTTTEKQLDAFTANQTYGSCSESPPYDVFYGKGEPGSWVDITSEYGSAELQVGENGQWEKKVYFETAPAGTPFGVRIADQYGRVIEFEFVYTP